MSTVKPASLNFLTIFSPALGVDEASQRNQILFYHSAADSAERERSAASQQEDLHEKQNERLRQVGLAQGLIAFARGFSNGLPVDSIETEKHRIVLSEIEKGWWVLASINLTILPSHRTNAPSTNTTDTSPSVEYSAREVSPSTLLVQQLLCAHRVFLLHHSPSLGELYEKLSRTRFCHLLERYWTQFALHWDVLLHGNPGVEIYGGIKLAAGGELGMGVGEEEWGSGEREVLEGLIENTEGLRDLVVMRFDDAERLESQLGHSTTNEVSASWLGTEQYAGPADGVLFSGAGPLSRRSLQAMYNWASMIYFYGGKAYGVKTNPTSSRIAPRRGSIEGSIVSDFGSTTGTEGSGVRRESVTSSRSPSNAQGRSGPLTSAIENSLENATAQADATEVRSIKESQSPEQADTYMKYLTLGYGTLWGGSTNKAKRPERATILPQKGADSTSKDVDLARNGGTSNKEGHKKESKQQTSVRTEDEGHYLIGLMGSLSTNSAEEDGDSDERLVIRTVHVEMAQDQPAMNQFSDESDLESVPSEETILPHRESERTFATRRLRLVLYVHRPFMFFFFFDPATSSLTLPSFFHTLHKHLAPLHKPLLNSTSPDVVAARLKTVIPAVPPPPPDGAIYDLIYDSKNLTVHTSIPNIPKPGTLAAEGFTAAMPSAASDQTWTRVEALNVHAQILATHAETRRSGSFMSERERTVKTGKGWWVLWMQMATQGHDDAGAGEHAGGWKEAFLVRRAAAQDQGPLQSAKATASNVVQGSAGFGLARLIGLGGGAAPESDDGGTPGQNSSSLSEGIGVDARKYVESLLSLNR